MDDEHNIYFDEFKNKLIILENSLIDVQNGKYSLEEINEIFRAIHTIKGTADLLGMFGVVTICNKAEDLLQLVRENKIKINSVICELYLELKNFISLVVENVSLGIFDDEETEKLFIDFEKEFNYHIGIAEDAQYEYKEVKTILVVDDSALVRYMIKKIATDEGYSVLTCENVKDAWTKIEGNMIDLLMCNFSLSNKTSLNLINMIKSHEATKNLAIVMLVNTNDDECISLGKQMAAKAWLKKPIQEAQLKIVLKKLLATN
ncbi:MAG: response regulator [Arcobacteraceae bacterium]